MSKYEKIHESEYGDEPHNFHVGKGGDTLTVELTYPPRSDVANTHDQCRYIVVNQESVRASDGIRLVYDYDRDGFSIQQETSPDNWQEVYFAMSWALDEEKADAAP